LGNSGERVQLFVQNLIRFKNGESISDGTSSTGENSLEAKKGKDNADIVYGADDNNSNARQSAKQGITNMKPARSKRQQQQDRKDKRQKEAQQKKEKLRADQAMEKQKRDEERQRQQRIEDETRSKREREEQQKLLEERQRQEGRRKAVEAATLATRVELQKKKNSKPPPPQRGKATTICGCFGTMCKPLTNCLHCGRIACTTEGYGYCPYCGYLIQDIDITLQRLGDSASMEKAILHKERLLGFDSECAKRTRVLDDQADYFKNSSSTWLSTDERERASEQDHLQRKKLHERKNTVMKLDILG